MLATTPSESDALAWMIIGGFSAWGGIVRYLMEIRQKQIKWSWFGIISQVVISVFTGLLGGLLSFEHGASRYMSYMIAGLFGSMGSTTLIWLWQRILGISNSKEPK
ncbi:phage holin family protein [Proteus mirabilis]|uniref:phage holin family protein n=1 Tax=Proteus mirabilis TaxID=584 RepID=UPI00073BEDFF|nr:phage holin family protein [Proteus mirabilis]AZG99966.1 holin [Proteus mirabilis]KSY04128.1 holin [Proteus mirabilis]MBG2990447.1 phage holin family protein [Proteus mirabilis]MBG6016581.1 phage holin family protein [Proteus mirabilis]MBG6041460.1 phage holin family protein [Proteus mirabilis]